MLKKNKKTKIVAQGSRFVIVASQYNAKYVDAMLKAAQATLLAGGAREIEVIRVPGAFEIPVVVGRLARSWTNAPNAILCLGVIIQGATAHAQHIGEAITQALMRLQIDHGVPCIHEVLLLRDEAQAKARCLDPETNRGTEAAQTALAMAKIMKHFADDYHDVPF